MNKKKGFTLVELLVVIAILGILAVIGVASYINAPKNARDAKRKADIDAIVKALEINKTQNGYTALSATQFTNKSLPADPGGSYVYCAVSSANMEVLNEPTVWSDTNCPENYQPLSDGEPLNPVQGAKSWIICARLENNTSDPIYCNSSAQ